jgi:hypothetical protein
MPRFIRAPQRRVLGFDLGDWSLLVAGFIVAGIVAGVLGRFL